MVDTPDNPPPLDDDDEGQLYEVVIHVRAWNEHDAVERSSSQGDVVEIHGLYD